MKTQVQARKTTSKIPQRSQTSKGNSQEKSRFNLEGSQLESDEATALHTPDFNFSNIEINPSLLLKTTGGTPMPKDVQQKMEASFNTDFSDVRIHEGKEAESIGAVAYAHRNHIHFQSGKYQPKNLEGQRILGHELAHVTQQREGRVSAQSSTVTLPNLDPKLETEANTYGEKAAQGKLVRSPIENGIGRLPSTISQGSFSTVQCMRAVGRGFKPDLRDLDKGGVAMTSTKKIRREDKEKKKKDSSLYPFKNDLFSDFRSNTRILSSQNSDSKSNAEVKRNSTQEPTSIQLLDPETMSNFSDNLTLIQAGAESVEQNPRSDIHKRMAKSVGKHTGNVGTGITIAKQITESKAQTIPGKLVSAALVTFASVKTNPFIAAADVLTGGELSKIVSKEIDDAVRREERILRGQEERGTLSDEELQVLNRE